ncbi:DNA mismatch repair endonuclease MutL [Treponema sp. OMZ 840]|uniref:DNA mismatch repair endonuclease MutL n=1 Tax=Treponema sp. OMZ 840 TaxID=244313 RepID=UPI003D907B6A
MNTRDIIHIKPVKTLAPEVARKIAAGEVIDRPAAVLREFLDNAVDAGADRITAEIESGGISCIRVADNGCGMSKEDLELCTHPHATSKITSDSDLEALKTLGFRGEALASIAAVSRLEITSSRQGQAWRIETGPEGKQTISPATLPAGTTALCRGLFDNFPARHRFLKRPQAETALCKQTFIDKSLPFANTAFRFICDSKIRFDFPAGQSLTQRFCSALEMNEHASLFYEIHSHPDTEKGLSDSRAQGEPWSFSIVLGETGIYRSDRKLMYVFVNGRRVQEYALLQAMDYGAEGYFPNGTHPAACLFLNIDSSLVDFNIHPAKKEVRFKDIGPIHHSISTAVRNFYKNASIRSLTRENRQHAQNLYETQNGHLFESDSDYAGERFSGYCAQTDTGHSDILPNAALKDTALQNSSLSDTRLSDCHNAYAHINRTAAFFRSGAQADLRTAFSADEQGDGLNRDTLHGNEKQGGTEQKSGSLRYIGSALGVFLIAEKDGDLYLVDQHAGHERILFESFLESAGETQALLVPLVIETPSPDDDIYLENLLPELQKAGFTMKNCGSGRWEAESVPAKWQGTERDLQSDLLDKRIAPGEIIRSLAATSACRSAVKDGHMLDPQTAQELLVRIFSLKDPHCPHGRPIWKKITKDELFQAVRRTR